MIVVVRRPQRARSASCRRTNRSSRSATEQSSGAGADGSANDAVFNSFVPVSVVLMVLLLVLLLRVLLLRVLLLLRRVRSLPTKHRPRRLGHKPSGQNRCC